MINIPQNLQQAIEEEIQRLDWHEVTEAREELTDRYRQHSKPKGPLMTKEAHRLSYVATRMPATFAVCYKVLEEIRQRTFDTPVKSLLDLGAGPGTVMWAASEIFPEIETMTLMEKDMHLIEIGKKFGGTLQANWNMVDLEQIPTLPAHDLITLSYSVGELPLKIIPELIEQCWKATQKILVVIEPGTPQGFERIRTIRSQLIELGAYIVAPCPHALTCPMTGGDWCHFSERVERSFAHRRLKGATLGYEDEKYSYIAVSKTPAQLPESRVLRHPMKHSGHVNLTLCTPEGLKQVTISKRNGEAYKKAKKLEWGSAL